MALLKTPGVNPRSQGLSGLAPARFAISQDVKTGLLKDRTSFWSFVVSLLFVVFEVLLITFYWKGLPPVIPLFYSRTWGSSMLAQQMFIWLIPAMAFFFIFINFCIVIFFLRENKFLNRALCFTSILVGFATFYGILRTLTLLS